MIAYAGELWLNWSYLHRDEVLFGNGSHKEIDGRQGSSSVGYWWQNDGFPGGG